MLISTTARLRAPFVPLGVVPEAAGSLLMPAVMGDQRAALTLYTGEWITADDAVACGLALRVVAPDALMTETMDLARPRIAAHARQLARGDQAAGVVGPHRRCPRGAGPRRRARSRRWSAQPANLEALTAFLEKREPDFRSSAAPLASPA